MSAYPRPLRMAVGLTLVLAGLIGLWLSVPTTGWIVYRWVVGNNQPSVLLAVLVVGLIAFNAAQVVVGAWVLAARDYLRRISIPRAAGVLLLLGTLLPVRNLIFVLFVVPQHALTEMFLNSPNRAAAYVALTHDLLGVLGAVLLVWMILDRLLRGPRPPQRTSQPAA